MTPHKPIIWYDLDGVLKNFRKGVIDRFGVDVERDTYEHIWSEIMFDASFWSNLEDMEGAFDIWHQLEGYDRRILSGGCRPLEISAAGKTASVHETYGPDVPVIITDARLKQEFCRPGDILIDDKQQNVERWREAGGIGILHFDPEFTLHSIRQLGLFDGRVPDPGNFEANPSPPPRETAHLFVDSEHRAVLVEAFQPPLKPGANSRMRTVCGPVVFNPSPRNFVPESGFAEIEAVGEHVIGDAHVIAVAVDGSVLRPDGGICHFLYSGNSQTLTAADEALRRIVDEQGVDAVCNLPAERRVTVTGEWRFKNSLAHPPAPKRSVDYRERIDPWDFPSGITGSRKTVWRGDEETYLYRDDQGRNHNEDGKPAIVRRFIPTGKVVFTAHWEHGEFQFHSQPQSGLGPV